MLEKRRSSIRGGEKGTGVSSGCCGSLRDELAEEEQRKVSVLLDRWLREGL